MSSQKLGVLVISKDRDAFYDEVAAFLEELGIAVLDSKWDANFTVVLGGDGTVLSAARAGIPSPVVVINTGHLGFLTSCSKTTYKEKLRQVVGSMHSNTSHHMLDISVAGIATHYRTFAALNDLVIRHAEKLVKIAVYAKASKETREELVCEYRSDGLIVATPTGSTAYSLSANGPIIHPSCRSFIINPICPQGLTQRPIVLPAHFTLRIQPLDDDLTMSVDGQVTCPLTSKSSVMVHYNSSSLNIVNPAESYFTVLQNKLGWGVRPV